MPSPTLSRRRALALLGGSVLTVGIFGTHPLASSKRVVGETFTDGDVSVTVENARIQKSVIVDDEMWHSIQTGEGQYLVVDVTTNGVDDGAPGFAAVADDDRTTLDTKYHILVKTELGRSDRNVSEFDGQPIAFSVPTDRFDRVAVAWRRTFPVSWDVEAGVIDDMARAPSFEVSNFEVIREDETLVVVLDVQNSGDRNGTFRGVLSHNKIADDTTSVALDVPMGEAVHHRATPRSLQWLTNEEDVDVRLAYGTGSMQATMQKDGS